MFKSWIKAGAERDAARIAERLDTGFSDTNAAFERDEWTGEAWRDHRAPFKRAFYAAAAREGVSFEQEG